MGQLNQPCQGHVSPGGCPGGVPYLTAQIKRRILLCRSINGVDGVDSDESDPLEVGQPGKVGKPVVQSGLTGFVVSFSPGEC